MKRIITHRANENTTAISISISINKTIVIKTITIALITAFIAASTAVSFTACGRLPLDKLPDYLSNISGSDSDTTDTDRAAHYEEIEAIALNEDGGSLLFYTLTGINSSLVSVNTQNAELIALDGTVITADDFKTGQLVIINYDGMIAESYPGQIFNCYGIRITGDAYSDEANAHKAADALNEYKYVHTIE